MPNLVDAFLFWSLQLHVAVKGLFLKKAAYVGGAVVEEFV